MKAGWQTKTLAEACEFFNGLWKGEKEPFVNVGVIRNTNFTKEGGLDDSDIAYLDVEVKKFEKRRLQFGDIILEKSGGGPKQPVGRVALFDKDDGLFSFSNFTSAIRVKNPSELDFRFLHKQLFWTYSSGVTEGLQNHSTGIRNLDGNAYKAIQIAIPPLPEQHRIVALLDEAFDGIATAKANAEKNLQNARALFESHLQSVFTEQGKGWEKKTLEAIATTFSRGKSRHRPRNAPHLFGGRVPFVQTGDIRNAEHVITEYSQTYSEAGLAQSKLWPKGTVCITIAANIAETAILGFDACFPDSVIGVVANPKEADVDFIEYLLQSFKARIQSMGKGSAQANINMGTFEYERFPFPPVAVQKAIVAKLDALNGETQLLESLYQQKLTALDDLKKSLLHQAFSGQL
ncbi:MAG: restriction endonuclease subunit S [Hyphomicrobiales bacterium]|nr:restriction endonuclease subunit S [Hyphomicrobiales bacterium]